MWNKTWMIFVSLALVAGCAATPSSQKGQGQKADAGLRPTVAVVPLAVEDPDRAWVGQAVAEGINRRLFARDDVNHCSTRQVAAAMRQARVSLSELDDPKALTSLGRHLGASFVLVGKISGAGGSARVVEVANGKTRESVKVQGPESGRVAMEERLSVALAAVVGGKLVQPAGWKAPPEAALADTTRALMILQQQSLSPRSANPEVSTGIPAEKLDEAKKLAEAGTKTAADFPLGWTVLSLSEAVSGNADLALELMEKSAVKGGGEPLSILTKGYAIMRQGRFEEAEKHLRDAVNAHPGFLHGRASLAELLLHFGRLREARAAFETYLKIVPDHPWVLVQIGYVDSQLGDAKKAVEQTRRAAALIPSSSYLLTEVASRQIDASDLEGAKQTLTQVLEMAPDHARAHVRLGYVMLLTGDDEGAISISKKVLEITKDSRYRRERAYAHLNMARALGHKGQVEESLNHLEAARKEADVGLDEFEEDPALEAVRNDPRYLEIVE